MSHITVLTTGTPGLETGDANLSVTGTGLSIPWGIDAVFQYNGMLFNDRGTVDKIRILSIDGLDDPDVRDVREENPADDGEIAYDSSYGGRTLVFNGRIEAYQRDKLRDIQLAIRSAFSDIKTEKPLYFFTNDNSTDHFINCKKSQSLKWTEEQTSHDAFFRNFQLTLRASNPRFLRRLESRVSGLVESDMPLEVLNFGNYWAEPKYVITGPASNVEFEVDNDDGTFIQFFRLKSSVSIAAGDAYVIDVNNKTVTNAVGQNKFGDVDPTSDFPKITSGFNLLSIPTGKFTGTNSSTEIAITFRDSFI